MNNDRVPEEVHNGSVVQLGEQEEDIKREDIIKDDK